MHIARRADVRTPLVEMMKEAIGQTHTALHLGGQGEVPQDKALDGAISRLLAAAALCPVVSGLVFFAIGSITLSFYHMPERVTFTHDTDANILEVVDLPSVRNLRFAMVKETADMVAAIVQNGNPDLDMATALKAAFEAATALMVSYATSYRKAWEEERKSANTRLRDRFKDKQEELLRERQWKPKGSSGSKGDKGKKGGQSSAEKSGAGFNTSQADIGLTPAASSITETPSKRAAPPVPGATGSNKKP